ncbi:MAG: hypothetical protein WDM96_17290 [Lacunisphaera sp.]
MKKIRVLEVDDEPLAREGVVAMLGGDPEVEIVGTCADGQFRSRRHPNPAARLGFPGRADAKKGRFHGARRAETGGSTGRYFRHGL